MRYGFTTGSCAAAAAKAAAYMLLTGREKHEITITTPKGILYHARMEEISRTEHSVRCAVRKDGGDDPDITTGTLIFAEVSWQEQKQEKDCGKPQILITGGTGVGTVTRPGLDQPVGSAAINHVPREMITREVEEVCALTDYAGSLLVEISVQGGEELAQKTFNPRLGIVGGISILGTSGIVEPMSEKALISSIEVEMKQKASGGKQYLLVAPGNYGLQYLSGHFPFDADEAVKCSNYVGQTIDFAVNMGLKGILFVAHIGKFIKVAGGIMNTHSRDADARMEILAANALRAGADVRTAKQILDAVTTDEGLAVLKQTPYWTDTMQLVAQQVEYYLNHRAQGQLIIGAVLYSNAMGELGRTTQAERLLENLIKERKTQL